MVNSDGLNKYALLAAVVVAGIVGGKKAYSAERNSFEAAAQEAYGVFQEKVNEKLKFYGTDWGTAQFVASNDQYLEKILDTDAESARFGRAKDIANDIYVKSLEDAYKQLGRDFFKRWDFGLEKKTVSCQDGKQRVDESGRTFYGNIPLGVGETDFKLKPKVHSGELGFRTGFELKGISFMGEKVLDEAGLYLEGDLEGCSLQGQIRANLYNDARRFLSLGFGSQLEKDGTGKMNGALVYGVDRALEAILGFEGDSRGEWNVGLRAFVPLH